MRSKGIVTFHPVAFSIFDGSPSRIITSEGRRRSGSTSTAIPFTVDAPIRKLEHLLDRPGAARAEIVDLAGLAALEKQPVAPDHVANVGEVTPRLEIPHPHHGLAPPRLDLRHLLGEVGRHEDVAAAGALVAEGARAHDGQAIAHEVLVAHDVLRDLAHRVGRERPERVRLPDGQLLLVDHPVFLAAPHTQKARRDGERPDGLEQVHLRQDIVGERLRGRLPRRAHDALRGQMHDVVRARPRDERPHRRVIPQVGLDEGDAPAQMLDVLGRALPSTRAEDLGALGERVLRHVAADEARDAGDQHPHGSAVYKRAIGPETPISRKTARGTRARGRARARPPRGT